MTTPNGNQDQLRSLLRDYNEHPEQRSAIVSAIEQQFQCTVGILVLDSSGFTRTVRRSGIVHFLALLERLQRVVLPVIARHHGRLLRTEADNIFAVFDNVLDATQSAADIMRTVKTVNDALPETDELYVAIGIGYGTVLLIGDHDLYGDEVNLACKLGEDLAQSEEILLTPLARQALGEPSWPIREESYSISGLHLTAFSVLWAVEPGDRSRR